MLLDEDDAIEELGLFLTTSIITYQCHLKWLRISFTTTTKTEGFEMSFVERKLSYELSFVVQSG